MGEGRSGSICLRCYRFCRNAALSDTTLPYPVLPCEIFFTGSRKNNGTCTVSWLQLSSRKLDGYSFQCAPSTKEPYAFSSVRKQFINTCIFVYFNQLNEQISVTITIIILLFPNI